MHQACRMPTYNQIELEFRILVFEKGGRPEITAKNPRSRDENQKQPSLSTGSVMGIGREKVGEERERGDRKGEGKGEGEFSRDSLCPPTFLRPTSTRSLVHNSHQSKSSVLNMQMIIYIYPYICWILSLMVYSFHITTFFQSSVMVHILKSVANGRTPLPSPRSFVYPNPSLSAKHAQVPYPLYLIHDSGLLQKVLFNPGSFNNRISVEVDVDVLSKPTRVVISHGLRVAER